MTAKTMTACSWKNADDCSTNFHYPPDSGMYSMTYSDAERYAAYRVREALEEVLGKEKQENEIGPDGWRIDPKFLSEILEAAKEIDGDYGNMSLEEVETLLRVLHIRALMPEGK